MKRALEGDSDTLKILLSDVRECLLKATEQCSQLLEGRGSAGDLQASNTALMRCVGLILFITLCLFFTTLAYWLAMSFKQAKPAHVQLPGTRARLHGTGRRG